MSPIHQNDEVVQPLTVLIEWINLVLVLRYACSGLSTFDAFGIICDPIMRQLNVHSDLTDLLILPERFFHLRELFFTGNSLIQICRNDSLKCAIRNLIIIQAISCTTKIPYGEQNCFAAPIVAEAFRLAI
jgi:hypothetical protein